MSKHDDSDELARRREVELSGVIDDTRANELVAKLLFLQYHDQARPIKLLVNSPGGSVAAALGIIDTIEFISCPVHTRCTGLAGGVAGVILASGRRGRRVAVSTAQVSIGPITTHPDQPITERDYRKLLNDLVTRLVRYTGQADHVVRSMLESGRLMDAVTAQTLGLIDGVEG
jgi:ATP-dependent Clp protease, protease subunit